MTVAHLSAPLDLSTLALSIWRLRCRSGTASLGLHSLDCRSRSACLCLPVLEEAPFWGSRIFPFITQPGLEHSCRALTEPALHPELSRDSEPPSCRPLDLLSLGGLPIPSCLCYHTALLNVKGSLFFTPACRPAWHFSYRHAPASRSSCTCKPPCADGGGGGRSLRALAAGLLIH